MHLYAFSISAGILNCIQEQVPLIPKVFFYFSASGIFYYANPPTFKSDSNFATLRFISDRAISETGILMAYVLGKYLYF